VQSGYLDLIQAILALLDADEPPEEPNRYQPPKSRLWTASQAMARMRQILAEAPTEHDMLTFLPELLSSEPDLATRTRAAIASTLIAGLELTRAGEVQTWQQTDFATITISPLDRTAPSSEPALADHPTVGVHSEIVDGT